MCVLWNYVEPIGYFGPLKSEEESEVNDTVICAIEKT